MRMVDLIIKKRTGNELTDEEIRFWIKNYTSGEIPEYQTSAMTMAILFKGMSKREIATLTDAMEHSGDIIDLSQIKGIKIDKHSTGGVGDKTTIVLGPMVAACGAPMVKLSGRGLGHTGGTLDKLESIPGFNVSLSEEELIRQVNEIGIVVCGQTKNLVPADKKMYALRDVTGTVESIPLIAASVMSKKLAAGTDGILLEVTVGNGAFMKTIEDARNLAKEMVDIGTRLNKNTIAILTNMNEPLGFAVGNSLEIKEAVESLKGNGPEDLMELCYTSGSYMLVQSKIAKNIEEAKAMLHKVIEDGSAYKKLQEMVIAQGGDVSYVLDTSKFEEANNIVSVVSENDGYIKEINALEIGLSSMKLGGGRETINDVIDMSAGIILNKKIGDKVQKGELLCKLYTNKSKDEYSEIAKNIVNAFVIVPHYVEHENVIKEIVA